MTRVSLYPGLLRVCQGLFRQTALFQEPAAPTRLQQPHPCWFHRITESLRLEKTTKIIESNHQRTQLWLICFPFYLLEQQLLHATSPSNKAIFMLYPMGEKGRFLFFLQFVSPLPHLPPCCHEKNSNKKPPPSGSLDSGGEARACRCLSSGNVFLLGSSFIQSPIGLSLSGRNGCTCCWCGDRSHRDQCEILSLWGY